VINSTKQGKVGHLVEPLLENVRETPKLAPAKDLMILVDNFKMVNKDTGVRLNENDGS
jgi:hypothetical protein